MVITQFKLERIKKGLTQWQLSGKTKISQQRLSLLETGQAGPTQKEKEILCKFFRSYPAVLFPNFFDSTGWPRKCEIQIRDKEAGDE